LAQTAGIPRKVPTHSSIIARIRAKEKCCNASEITLNVYHYANKLILTWELWSYSSSTQNCSTMR